MVSFRGASAEAAAVLTDQVGEVAQATAATVAGDLFAVADSLRAEGSLRRFLTDGSVDSAARSGLASQVYGGKVDPASLPLVSSAAERRWTRGRDLADALEQVGVIAAVRSAGADSERVVNELFTLRQVVNDNSELRNALSDPTRPAVDKAALLESLVSGKAHPATLLLARQALAGSFRTVTAALEDYEKTAAEVHGQGVATVRVARELGDGEQQRLASALERHYGRPVHLNIVVDPAVLGGIKVEIGDDVIDGTVTSRLDDARRKIAG